MKKKEYEKALEELAALLDKYIDTGDDINELRNALLADLDEEGKEKAGAFFDGFVDGMLDRKTEELFTFFLRENLAKILLKKIENKSITEDLIISRLQEWIDFVRCGNLAEWLTSGGSQKIDLDELNKRAACAAPDPVNIELELGKGETEKPPKKHPFDSRLIFILFKVNAWKALCFRCSDEKEKNWLAVIAYAWLIEKLKTEIERAEAEADRLKREADAKPLEKAKRVHIGGREYSRLPKVTAGMSWAFGGPFIELSNVTLDGKTYAPAPDLAIMPKGAIVPAGYALLPPDYAAKAHQTLLPLDMQGGDDAPPLPVALAGATQYAITPAAGKLGLVVMAAAHARKGKLHKTTLRELTNTINPDARLVKSHFETVCKGLVQLDGLRLVLPNGMAYRVFESPIPWRDLTPEEYDAPLFVGMTRTFEKTLAVIQDAAGKSYKGDFLFDLTGAMALPTKRPGLIRQYIRACAFWNSYWIPGTKGEPDLDRIPKVDAGRWAIMTNYLPPAAAEYLKSKGGDRRTLSHSIKDTVTDAEELAEMGLVKIAAANTKDFRLLPPPQYLEAWHKSRTGAHKMAENGG